MSYFNTSRNCELSVIYGVDTQVQANWTGITVVKSNPNFDAVALPIITARLLATNNQRKEIGSRTMDSRYNFVVDIYAKSDGQRLDLAQFLEDTILQDFTYYTHSQTSGSPQTLTRTDAGKVKFIEFTQNTRIYFFEEVEAYDRFRHVLAFDVRIGLNA